MGFTRASSDPARRHQLTPRQREILVFIAKGQTNAEIAVELGLSLDGVKWHVREILGRLDVESREEAAAVWQRDQRPTARLGRIARGIAAVPLFVKGAALSGLAAVVVGGSMVMVAARSQDAPALPDPATFLATDLAIEATNGVADLTVDQATERVLAYVEETLATEVLLEHGPGDVPFAGRTLHASDLLLLSRTFDANDNALLPERWTMTFGTDGLRANRDDDGAPMHLAVTVVIADGDAALLDVAVAEGPSERPFNTAAEYRARARGEPAGPPEAMPADHTYLLPMAVLDLGMRRLTMSIYGDPADPCLRLDDTSSQGGVALVCPMQNMPPTGQLLGMMRGDGYIAGTANDEVREALHREPTGQTPVTLRRPPAPYDPAPRAFLHAASGGTLVLFGDASDVEAWPLDKPGQPTAGAPLRSIGNFSLDETGSATTPSFDVPNPGAAYPFIFQFPADGGPVRVTAECDAGSTVIIDDTAPLSPIAGSMLVTFPPGSSSCSFRVEAGPGVRWQLSPK